MTSDTEWFLQLDERQALNDAGLGAWTVLWEQKHDDETVNLGRFCALASPSRREANLDSASWDLMVDSGEPGFTVWHEAGERRVEYARSSATDEGVEPLIYHRAFHG